MCFCQSTLRRGFGPERAIECGYWRVRLAVLTAIIGGGKIGVQIKVWI